MLRIFQQNFPAYFFVPIRLEKERSKNQDKNKKAGAGLRPERTRQKPTRKDKNKKNKVTTSIHKKDTRLKTETENPHNKLYGKTKQIFLFSRSSFVAVRLPSFPRRRLRRTPSSSRH